MGIHPPTSGEDSPFISLPELNLPFHISSNKDRPQAHNGITVEHQELLGAQKQCREIRSTGVQLRKAPSLVLMMKWDAV